MHSVILTEILTWNMFIGRVFEKGVYTGEGYFNHRRGNYGHRRGAFWPREGVFGA